MKRIGDSVKAGREMRQLTQMQLSRKAGIAQAHLSEIEKGLAQPSFIKLLDIARALSLPVDFFVPDEYRSVTSIPVQECVGEKVIGEFNIKGNKLIKIIEKEYVE